MSRIRVLVVDDAVVARKVLSDVLSEDPNIEVMGTAANGRLALARLAQGLPDVVVLDVEMPELDGIATLTQIRRLHPTLPVVMCSTMTQRGAMATLDALAAGANDYVTKPSNTSSLDRAKDQLREQLVPKVRHFGGQRGGPTSGTSAPSVPRPQAVTRSPVQVVVIGSSTGGPNALAEVFRWFPRGFPVPVLVAQHMPPVFTHLLAQRLAAGAGIPVEEAVPGTVLDPGRAWIAPGDFHLVLSTEGGVTRLKTHQEPPENSCRPAVDPLFRSAAATFGPGVLGIVLTGMGQDGLRGAEAIVERGGTVLVQDEASSVVWGMPSFVAKAGLATEVLPLDRIGPAVVRRVAAR